MLFFFNSAVLVFTGNTKVYRVKVFFIKLILTKKLSSVWTIIYFVDLVPWQRFYFSVTTLKEFVITTKHKNSTLHECNATLKVKAVDMQMDTFHKILRNEPAVETSYVLPPHSLCSSAISRRGTDHGNTFFKTTNIMCPTKKSNLYQYEAVHEHSCRTHVQHVHGKMKRFMNGNMLLHAFPNA